MLSMRRWALPIRTSGHSNLSRNVRLTSSTVWLEIATSILCSAADIRNWSGDPETGKRKCRCSNPRLRLSPPGASNLGDGPLHIGLLEAKRSSVALTPSSQFVQPLCNLEKAIATHLRIPEDHFSRAQRSAVSQGLDKGRTTDDLAVDALIRYLETQRNLRVLDGLLRTLRRTP